VRKDEESWESSLTNAHNRLSYICKKGKV
jgi:hypothetical protein